MQKRRKVLNALYSLFFLSISSRAARRLSLIVCFAAFSARNNSCNFQSLTSAISKSVFFIDIVHL